MSNTVYARDPSGNPIELQTDASGALKISGDITIGDITLDNVEIANDVGNPVPSVLTAGTAAIGKLTALPGLDIPAHDYIALSYAGSDLTGVVYKTGGSSGTTVATLTLAYDTGVLVSVTKS